jgi:hypothetical protein
MSNNNFNKENEMAKIEHHINTMQADLYELIFNEKDKFIQEKSFSELCMEYTITINALKKKRLGFSGMLLSLAMAYIIKEGVYRGIIKEQIDKPNIDLFDDEPL